MSKLFLLAAAAAASLVSFGFQPATNNESFTRDGVTYVQRGGLKNCDFVVTNVDASAVSRVQSVNSKTGVVTLAYSDVGALPSSTTHLSGDVPTTRTVNEYPLSSDITLDASDVGALSTSDGGSVNGDVDVTGALTAASFATDGEVYMNGSTYIAEAQIDSVTGPASFDDDVSVSKDMTVGGSLTVTGATVFDGTLQGGGVVLSENDVTYNGTHSLIALENTVGGKMDADVLANVWNQETSYQKGAFVLHSYDYYESLTNDNIGHFPYSSPTYWKKMKPLLQKVTEEYVPTVRTVNGKPLSANVQLTANDIGISDFTTTTAVEKISSTQITNSVQSGYLCTVAAADEKIQNATNGLLRAIDYHGDYITDGTNTMKANREWVYSFVTNVLVHGDFIGSDGSVFIYDKSRSTVSEYGNDILQYYVWDHGGWGEVYGGDGVLILDEHGIAGVDQKITLHYTGEWHYLEYESLDKLSYTFPTYMNLTFTREFYRENRDVTVSEKTRLATTNDLYAVKTNAYTKSETDAAIANHHDSVKRDKTDFSIDPYFSQWNTTCEQGAEEAIVGPLTYSYESTGWFVDGIASGWYVVDPASPTPIGEYATNLYYTVTKRGYARSFDVRADRHSITNDTIAKTSQIPTALPNPNALTFTGAASGTYDGSAATTVNIPSQPSTYLKSATSTENSITVTKQDDTTVGLEVQYDYALTNLTGIAVSLASGQIGNVTLDNTQTNLSLSLDFSSNTNRSGDCMLLAFCGAETTLAVGPSQAVDILGTYEKLKAGTNLVMVTRMMMNGTNSVVMVNVREVK